MSTASSRIARPASSSGIAVSSASTSSARVPSAACGGRATTGGPHSGTGTLALDTSLKSAGRPALYRARRRAVRAQVTFAMARSSSPTENAPSKRAAIRPEREITNVHGSVTSRHAATGPCRPAFGVLSL
jgi:hypothetical protein